jgi:hypothetical protein
LFLDVDDEYISVQNTDGAKITVWRLDDLTEQFNKKVKNVLLVKAKVEIRDGIEWFYYDRAKLLSGGTSKSILKSKFENEEIVVDLRLHDKGTMARNHGTAFRVKENDIEDLYVSINDLRI